MNTLLDESWADFEPGMFSANVGPHTEYHFLSEAAPRNGWSVACFGMRPAGGEWRVADHDGRRALQQTHTSEWPHTHPMVTAGDADWRDVRVTVTLMPRSDERRCGVVVRYHNNRCYTFFGFDGDRIVLLRVEHERDFHVPAEEVLAAAPAGPRAGREVTAIIELEGPWIRATLDDTKLTAFTRGYLHGKVGLLADRPASFFSVRVEAEQKEVAAHSHRRRADERALAELREGYPQPLLWRRFETPGFGVGRNVRFGDIDGDGEKEIVIAQVVAHGERDEYSETGCITALKTDGTVLWQSGEPDPANYHLTNDVAFQVHDIDGDGVCEVIYARDFELVIADGRTGRARRKVPTPLAKPPADRFERILGDCLFFCDMRGTGRAADIVIKDRYWHFWVYDDELHPLWEASCTTGHYPYAFDVDGDGRDELAVGYSLFDDDGTLLWTLDGVLNDHADGIAILDFAEAPGSKPKILYAASDEGLLFVDTDGTILKHHRIGHAQNPVIARFRDDLPGYQAVSINFWGNQGLLHFFGADGSIYHDAEPLNMGSMCLPVNWTGGATELFLLNADPRFGGVYDGWGRSVVTFPDDGHPAMCNAVVDLTGDARDEVVVWDQNRMWIYTQSDGPGSGPVIARRRNPLYNHSNYQASVSLPVVDPGGDS
ncbi:MAG: hypothetical protein ACOCYX_02890 [Spirochaetota bacterium]